MEVSPSNGGIVKVNQNALTSYPVSLSYNGGEQVEVEAVPAAGYLFTGWSGTLSGSTNPITVVIDCNKQVVANFIKPGEYLLTMRVNGIGSTTPQVGPHRYTGKTTINITAIAEKGWKFDGWTGDFTDPTSSSTTVTVDTDKTCTANFSRIMHGVTLQVNGQGTTVPSSGYFTFGEGATLYISAIPSKGWKFDGWTGNVADSKSPDTTVLISADGVYTANFSRVNSMAWFIGGSVTIVLVIAVAVWFAIRRRTS